MTRNLRASLSQAILEAFELKLPAPGATQLTSFAVEDGPVRRRLPSIASGGASQFTLEDTIHPHVRPTTADSSIAADHPLARKSRFSKEPVRFPVARHHSRGDSMKSHGTEAELAGQSDGLRPQPLPPDPSVEHDPEFGVRQDPGPAHQADFADYRPVPTGKYGEED